MDIVFTKLSDEQHSVQVRRVDNSIERTVLNSRSFLRHDLAHLAVEIEVPLRSGYWGSVAAGASLAGMEIDGSEIWIAESLSGPVQTLMRIEGSIDEYETMLNRIQPRSVSANLAARLHERVRQLRGHWKATPYGSEMLIEWPEQIEKASDVT